MAGEGWPQGMAAIDRHLPFDLHFHRFALRNLNRTFGADNPLGARYINLDRQFPDGAAPALAADERLLPGDAARSYPDAIPSLEAHYYRFTVDDAVRQLSFDFGKLQPLLDRKVDAVVKIRNKPWAV